MRHVQSGGGVALRVEVDHQDPVAVQRERDRDVHRGRGLAHAALLVRDTNDALMERAGHGDLAARVQDLHGPFSLLRKWWIFCFT